MTRQLDWYIDFVSPFAWLQSESLHRLPSGVAVNARPVLFAGLLEARGQKGPAEIPSKRLFTYRHALWLASRNGIPTRFPPAHPFNPLKALRLAVALGSRLEVVHEIFRFIWREGNDPNEPVAWSVLLERLGVVDGDALVGSAKAKDGLRSNGDAALAAGVFGVPTFVVGGALFWGFDATDMLADWLRDPGLFATAEMARLATLPEGARRRGA